jgi:SAM-dependent methyltransferase
MKIWHTFLVLTLLSVAPVSADISHKSDNIGRYLNEIALYQEEKTQIVKHVLNKGSGRYLDIGSGGDSVARMIESIPNDVPVTIIASDLDDKILKEIPKRHKNLEKYLKETDNKKLNVELEIMDAVDMRKISTSSLDGINASALVHEVFSYAPAKRGIDQFFIESIRTLKPGGVLVYRDPLIHTSTHQQHLALLDGEMIKHFVTVFLPKLLDHKFTMIRDMDGKSSKPVLYDVDNITVTLQTKREHNVLSLSFKEFLNLPSTRIDYSKPMSIEAPRGLIQEIERHYVLFIKNVYSMGFIDDDKINSEGIDISEIRLSAQKSVMDFLRKNNKKAHNGRILPQDLDVLQQERKKLSTIVTGGVKLLFKNESTLLDFEYYLIDNDIPSTLYKRVGNDNILWIDAKIFSLVYRGENQGVLSYAKPLNNIATDSFNWLKREGEEYYYYMTPDDLLTYLAKLSMYELKNTDKEGYVLSPVDDGSILQMKRDLYESILDRDMKVMNMFGENQEFVASKVIIHFSVQKLTDALEVYKKIIQNNPGKFPKLAEWMKSGCKARKF